MADTSVGFFGKFAASVGATEPALRLLLTVLAGYPLALVHRHFFLNKSAAFQHLYFTICGVALGYFNYGTDMYHSLICILVVYFILQGAGGTQASAVFSFVFCMGYLLLGYYYTGTENYDIKWTMPHCILTLRLIGLAFDVYDGHKDQPSYESSKTTIETTKAKSDTSKLPYDQKRTALGKIPSLLEVMGHTYFFGSFLVGPQFPMRRYLDFVEGRFFEKKDEKPACVIPALCRFALGIGTLAFYQVSSMYFEERYLLSDDYQQLNFLQRLIFLAVWQNVCLHKYVACWLLAEGSCIMAGLTYNGKDENGNELWDGCININVWQYETTTTFGGIIRSFNINTNLWVAQYVFKRLKFLGNKMLSQGAALFFLALWHGFHSGYYICFLNEFIVMKLERDVIEIIERLPSVKAIVYHKSLQIPRLLFLKLYLFIMFGYCVVPFVLLSFDRWSEAYSRVYWIGHIIYGGWIPLSFVVFKLLPRKKREEAKEE